MLKVHGYHKRVFLIADTLSRHGYDVKILWMVRIKEYLINRKGLFRNRENVIYRPALPFYYLKFTKNISRLLAKFWVYKSCRHLKIDIIQAEMTLFGRICSGVHSVPMVVDLHGDFIAESMMQKKPNWHIELAQEDEKLALENASAVLAASEALGKTILERNNKPNIPLTIAPSGVEIGRFAPGIQARTRMRTEIGINNRIVFCYLGGVQAWQNIEETLDLFVTLFRLQPKFFLLFITNGDVSPYRERLNMLGKHEVNYRVMSLSFEELAMTLPVADLGLLLRSDSPVNRVSSPIKCGEYLAAGVPLITTPHAGDASNIVSNGRCGLVIDDVYNWDIEAVLTFVEDVNNNRKAWLNRCTEIGSAFHNWDLSKANILDMYSLL